MICPKCDSTSATGAVFCSRCGQSFVGMRDTGAPPYRAPAALPPPAPYYPPPQPQYALVPVAPMAMQPWRCFRCGYTGHPMYIQKMSSAGVTTMVLLILFFLPLFWIGFLMKETRSQCPHCRMVH